MLWLLTLRLVVLVLAVLVLTRLKLRLNKRQLRKRLHEVLRLFLKLLRPHPCHTHH
jgi:hypothetical protein